MLQELEVEAEVETNQRPTSRSASRVGGAAGNSRKELPSTAAARRRNGRQRTVNGPMSTARPVTNRRKLVANLGYHFSNGLQSQRGSLKSQKLAIRYELFCTFISIQIKDTRFF